MLAINDSRMKSSLIITSWKELARGDILDENLQRNKYQSAVSSKASSQGKKECYNEEWSFTERGIGASDSLNISKETTSVTNKVRRLVRAAEFGVRIRVMLVIMCKSVTYWIY